MSDLIKLHALPFAYIYSKILYTKLTNQLICNATVVLQHPELMLASYNANEDSPHDPDGVALVWNIKYKKNTPEYIFHCQVIYLSILLRIVGSSAPSHLAFGILRFQINIWQVIQAFR